MFQAHPRGNLVRKNEEPVEVGRKRITRATEDTPQKRTKTGATMRASQTEGPGRTLTRGTVLPVPRNITTVKPGPRADLLWCNSHRVRMRMKMTFH